MDYKCLPAHHLPFSELSLTSFTNTLCPHTPTTLALAPQVMDAAERLAFLAFSDPAMRPMDKHMYVSRLDASFWSSDLLYIRPWVY